MSARIKDLKDCIKIRSIPEPNSGCWIWEGAVCAGKSWGKEYGEIRRGKALLRAHRVSYEVYKGPIPQGMHVLHKCDVPACVNPDHLFLGTQTENNRDRDRKGRHVALRGEKHGLTNFTSEQILHIRQSAMSGSKLVREYKVGDSTISRIRRRKVWNHI